MQVRNWLWVEDFASAIDLVLAEGNGGRGLQRRRPRRARQHRRRQGDPRADRPRRVADHLRPRPPRPRPPLLARLGEDARARLGGQGRLRGRDRQGGRLVSLERGVVGPDPLRRVPRVLREALRQSPRLDARWPADRNEDRRARPRRGESLRRRARLPPRVVSRGRLARVRRRRRVRPGEPLALGQGDPARPALPDDPRPGEAGPLRARRDLGRRRRPPPRLADLRRWEGYELSDENHRQLFVPVGFAHGFCVLSDVADVAYKVSSYYDPETEVGIAWNDPEVGVEWPVDDPQTSERDTSAPKLSRDRRRAAVLSAPRSLTPAAATSAWDSLGSSQLERSSAHDRRPRLNGRLAAQSGRPRACGSPEPISGRRSSSECSESRTRLPGDLDRRSKVLLGERVRLRNDPSNDRAGFDAQSIEPATPTPRSAPTPAPTDGRGHPREVLDGPRRQSPRPVRACELPSPQELLDSSARSTRRRFEQPARVRDRRSVDSIGSAWPRKRSVKSDPLAGFSPAVRRWFEASFEAPTPAQAKGWPAIATGRQHADLRAHRIGQDAHRVPLGDRQALARAEPRGGRGR